MSTARQERLARLYVALVVLSGALAICWSIASLTRQPVGSQWLLLASLTVLSGSATVKIPSIPAALSISETFVFVSILLFGVHAGTLIVAIDGLIASLSLPRAKRQPHRIAFNVAGPALSVWFGAQAFLLALPTPLATGAILPISLLVGPLALLTLIYFAFNTGLVALAISLHESQPLWPTWKHHFAWVALDDFAGASLALLLVSYTRALTLTYIFIAVPLLLVVYFTYKSSMGRTEDALGHLGQMNRLYLSTIEALAMAIDAKDQITHGHIRRVQAYAVGLAKSLGVSDASAIKAIEAAALLHDTGKLAVPEYILNKPGKLTPAEFEKMKLHATVGADILTSVDFPFPVVPIVRHHHENWDGTGYPDGLRGTEIPIGARILSVVDCFDALTSDRPYRPRLSDQEAIAILAERRGTMYDPLIVDTFIRVRAAIAPDETAPALGASDRPRALAGIARMSSEVSASVTFTDHRNFDMISASADEILTLHELATSLAEQTALADIAAIATRHLRRLIPASLYVFYLYDTDRDELAAGPAVGQGESIVAGLRIPLGERLSGWVAANRQAILNSDPVLDLGEAARSAKPRLTHCLSTPMVVGDDLIAVLTLYAAGDRPFAEDHCRVIEAVARQLSHAVARALAFEKSCATALRSTSTGAAAPSDFSSDGIDRTLTRLTLVEKPAISKHRSATDHGRRQSKN